MEENKNLPVITNQEIEETKTKGSLALARLFRDKTMAIKTPSRYIKLKDKFPYIPSNYEDDLFNKIYPIHTIKVINITTDDYYVLYTVEITVVLPDNTTITKNGVGGSRLQVTREAKDKVISGKGNITPFDYVDKTNNFKAAYTLALKNCYERFGIGADVCDRIILSSEEINQLNTLINTIIDKYIINPRDKSTWKSKQDEAKSIKDKLELLQDLKEEFPESQELFIKEE